MIVVTLQGGLGNQLFQYAAGRAFAAKLKTKVSFDPAWFAASKQRTLKLDQFKLSPDTQIEIGVGKRLRTPKHVHERLPGFDPILTLTDNCIYDGYWQSSKYFEDIGQEIRTELELKNPPSKRMQEWADVIASSAGSVSLHIRRGDYLWEKHQSVLGVLPIAYYKEAIKMLAERIGTLTLFVFSDDIPWAKKNLDSPFKTYFVSDPTLIDTEELFLMSHCRHHIIANSSFSWWAAWINQKPEKLVLAPKNWFKDKEREPRDLIPDTWITL